MSASPAESGPDASENLAPPRDPAPTEAFPWLLNPARPTPAMGLLAGLHGFLVFNRRTRALSECFAEMLPADAKILDVGCGDGLIDHLITQRRPDLSIMGIDLIVRPETHVTVQPFDGKRIPFEDGAFDVVMFVDVLHHTDDPETLLREAHRVARQTVVLKDHTRDGLLAGPTLRFMDWVGNAPHGIPLPYNYWPERRWREAFARLGLTPAIWLNKLGLYATPATWFFDRSLHFVARLDKV